MYFKLVEGLIRNDSIKENSKLSDTQDPEILLMLHISSSYQSFNSLNTPYFKKFVEIISNNSYKVPHRTTFSSNILDKTYNLILDEIVTYTKKCQSLALTTDGWCDNSSKHFWSLTVSGIDQDLKIESKVLSLKPVYNDFSARNIGNILLGILDKYGIEKHKIHTIVTDGGGACPNIHVTMNLNYYICSAHR